LKQAQNNLGTTINNAGDLIVRSQLAGKVYSLFKKEGELAVPQEPLAMLGKNDGFLMEFLIDEVDIAQIQTGQKVLVTLDAYGDKVWEALISKIYPAMNSRTQTFTVEATFIQPPKVLYPGLTGEANIVVAEKNNVLTIPYEYLVGGNKVLTENGDVVVTTGLQNFQKVEIKRGIDSTTKLLKP